MKLLTKASLVGAAFAALALGSVYAQQLSSNTLTGNEVVIGSIGGPQGTSLFIPTSQLRNATALHIFASVSGTPTYTATPLDSTLYWVGTAPTSWTITTPASPVDGEILQIGTDTTLTSMVTLTANTGQSLNSSFTSQTVTAVSAVEFQYSLGTTKWYRLH
jgi:hypothetical protein